MTTSTSLTLRRPDRAVVGAVIVLLAPWLTAAPVPVPLPFVAATTWQDGKAEGLVAEIGVPLELTMALDTQGAPRPQEFTIVAASAGKLTVDARSHDAPVVLAHLADDGKVLARGEGNAIAWNARLVLDAQGGERLRIGTYLNEAVAGTILIEATSGEVPLPTGFALEQQTARFRVECARAAEGRGEGVSAAIRYHEAGEGFYRVALYADCQHAYRAALPLAESAGHGLLTTLAKGYLGAVALKFGQPSQARELLVPACAGAVAEQHPALEMFCRSNLADACQQLGDLAQAHSEYDRSLAIAREIGDVAHEASLLAQRASLAVLEGDAQQGRELLEEARRAAESLEPDLLAQIVRSAATFHRYRGESAVAEQLLEQSLALATFPAVRAATIGELGNLRTEQGRWAQARDLYQEVLDVARELGDEGLQGAALVNLGVVAMQAGDVSNANASLQEALDLARQGPDNSFTVRVLLELASLRYVEERVDDAWALLEQASDTAQTVASDALSFRVLHLMALLASKDPARLDEAAEYVRREVEMAARTGSPADPPKAACMEAWVCHLRGRHDEAAELVARAVEGCAGAAPDLSAAALSTQIDIALARADLPTARAALGQARELMAGLPLRGMDTEAASLARSNWSYAQFAELEQDVIALSLTSAAERGSKPSDAKARAALVDEGFRAAGRAQARALLEGIAEHRSGARSAETVALRRQRQQLLADRQSTLAALARSQRNGATDDEIDTLRDRAGGLAAEADAVLADLRRRQPGEAALDAPLDMGPSDVQPLLRSDDVLVHYAEGQQRLYAYVLTRTSVEWRDLGDRDDLEAVVRDHLDGISDPARLATPGVVAGSGGKVWRALLRPLLPASDPGAGTLVIVPTPRLAGLPFESLVTEAAATVRSFADVRFVIDRYDVRYVPSPAVMSLLATTPARATSLEMLVLADPVVPGESLASRPTPRLANEASWVRLPGTRTEALAILDLLTTNAPEAPEGYASAPHTLPPEERGGHLRSELADVFLGPDATVARLQDDARRYSIVHVAAHGSVDATDPARTGLVLSPTPEDDGFLSVPEVLELDLDADLVVLSACDTARGTVRRGEGVQSLARAFLHAGAREVIATLWQVDDHETEVAMRSFYRGLREDDLSAPKALRQARLELRNPPADAVGFAGLGRGDLLPGAPPRVQAAPRTSDDLRGHPYFWAPFVVIGWSPRPR